MQRIIAATLILIAMASPSAARDGVWQYLAPGHGNGRLDPMHGAKVSYNGSAAGVFYNDETNRWEFSATFKGNVTSGDFYLITEYDAKQESARSSSSVKLHYPQGTYSVKYLPSQRATTWGVYVSNRFIEDLQKADRLILKSSGSEVVFPLQGSAKAVTDVYVGLGEIEPDNGVISNREARVQGEGAEQGYTDSHSPTDEPVGEADVAGMIAALKESTAAMDFEQTCNRARRGDTDAAAELRDSRLYFQFMLPMPKDPTAVCSAIASGALKTTSDEIKTKESAFSESGRKISARLAAKALRNAGMDKDYMAHCGDFYSSLTSDEVTRMSTEDLADAAGLDVAHSVFADEVLRKAGILKERELTESGSRKRICAELGIFRK